VLAIDDAQFRRLFGLAQFGIEQGSLRLDSEFIVVTGIDVHRYLDPFGQKSLHQGRIVVLLPDGLAVRAIGVRLGEHLHVARRRVRRRFGVVDGRRQQGRSLKFLGVLQHESQGTVAAHGQATNDATIAGIDRAVGLFNVRHQVVDEGALHLFLQVDVPVRIGIRHHVDGRRNLAVGHQCVDSLLQLALHGPVVTNAVVAVQQVHHGVAHVVAVCVAGGQVDVVGQGAAQRGALNLGRPHFAGMCVEGNRYARKGCGGNQFGELQAVVSLVFLIRI